MGTTQSSIKDIFYGDFEIPSTPTGWATLIITIVAQRGMNVKDIHVNITHFPNDPYSVITFTGETGPQSLGREFMLVCQQLNVPHRVHACIWSGIQFYQPPSAKVLKPKPYMLKS